MTEPDADDLGLKIIAEQGLLADMVEALDALVHEAKFQFLPGLIRTWAVDPANAAACYIDIKPEEPDQIQYYAVQEGGLVQGLKLNTLDELFSYADADQLVQIEFGEAHNWKFNISMPGVDANISGIDPDKVRDEPGMPDVEWPCQFTVPGKALKDAVELNQMFSDHTTIHTEDDAVTFLADGDTDDGQYRLEEGEGGVEFHQAGEEAQEVMQSLDYFADLAKVMKDCDEVRMKVATDAPTMFEFDLGTYMLAPRLNAYG